MIVKSDGNGSLIVPRWAFVAALGFVGATGFASVVGLVAPNARADSYTGTQAREDRASVLREIAHVTDAAILLTNKLEAHVLLDGHPKMEAAMDGLKSDMDFIRSMLVEMRDRLRKEPR